MQTTWILVADGAKARILEHQGMNRPLKPIKKLTHTNKPSSELVTTERGRMPDNSSGQRSAIDRSTDPHQQEKTLFAGELCDFLERKARNIDRLIVVAAPRLLGDLRRQLPARMKSKISDEMDKDLTNVPDKELPRFLQPVLNINADPGDRLSYTEPD